MQVILRKIKIFVSRPLKKFQNLITVEPFDKAVGSGKESKINKRRADGYMFLVLLSISEPFLKAREALGAQNERNFDHYSDESSHEHQFLVDKHAILCKLALIDSVNTKGLLKQCRLTLCKEPNKIHL